MKNNPIEKYALEATLRSYDHIVNHIEKVFGKGAASKNPNLVSTLLRFQEEMIRSTTEVIVTDKMSMKGFEDYLNK